MSEDKDKQTIDAEDVEIDEIDVDVSFAEPVEEAEAAEEAAEELEAEPTLETYVAALEARVLELEGALEGAHTKARERLMRMAADHENFKRRSERERDEVRRFGIEKVLLDMLPVVDNLERALDHSGRSKDFDSLLEGVRMVQRQFVQGLTKHGVEGFASLHQPFDPQCHEALQQLPTHDHEPGTVVNVFQEGYFLNGRLMRPARVVVATRPSTPPPAPPEPQDTQAPEGAAHILRPRSSDEIPKVILEAESPGDDDPQDSVSEPAPPAQPEPAKAREPSKPEMAKFEAKRPSPPAKLKAPKAELTPEQIEAQKQAQAEARRKQQAEAKRRAQEARKRKQKPTQTHPTTNVDDFFKIDS